MCSPTSTMQRTDDRQSWEQISLKDMTVWWCLLHN